MSVLPSFATLQPLEKTGAYTPLGIRFWDAACDIAITNGLEVTARPPGRPDLARRAFQTLSGVYAFQGLPGMHSLESLDPQVPAGALPPVSSPPDSHRFVIEVRDRLERFGPVTFKVDLPYRGIYPTHASSSPVQPALPGFFLFSSASRPVLSDLGIVRAQCVERVGPGQFRPAPFAVLELKASGGSSWYGIADPNGSVAVTFPYPAFSSKAGPVSPPPGPPESRLQSWDVTLRVHYRPDLQTKPDAAATLPDLGSILNQPLAKFWQTQAGPGQAQMTNRLFFGQPLVLQTVGLPELVIEQ